MDRAALRRKRRQRQRIKRFIFTISTLIVCVAGTLTVMAMFNGKNLPPIVDENSSTPLTGESTSSTSTAPTVPEPVRPVGPAQTNDTVLKASSTVEDSYFDDALFIGNSRTEGLMLYSGLEKAAFYTAKGLKVDTFFTEAIVPNGREMLTIPQALEKHRFQKIYIMLGVNELGWAYESVFIHQYGELLDTVKQLQPQAEVIVQSILPVSAEKSSSNTIYTNPRIRKYNDLLLDMCKEKRVYYANVAEAVADRSGALPAEATTDGVHLIPAYCVKWLDYLKAHTAPLRDFD